MRWLRPIVREVAGLFVDDGTLAFALLAWIGGGIIALRVVHAGRWGGPAFAAGIVIVLVENVFRFSHCRQTAGGENLERETTRRQD